MTPLAPCSTSTVVLFPGTTFVARKNNHLAKYKSYNILGKSSRQTLSSQRFLLPLSTSVRLFSNHRSGYSVQHASRAHILAATGTDIAVEEPDSSFSDTDTDVKTEVVSGAVETPSTAKSIVTPTSTKRTRSAGKSDMPPVTNEELVVGATFTGKVRSVQPFGAFVDFGAFTDGLVHVSQLSDGFVKDVGDIVSVGQEVKVRVLEANTENGRISLTMREGNDTDTDEKTEVVSGAVETPSTAKSIVTPTSTKRTRSAGKSDMPPVTNEELVVGATFTGKVRSVQPFGAFVDFGAFTDGLVHVSQLSDGFVKDVGDIVSVGQEVKVRLLEANIENGRISLTMREGDDTDRRQPRKAASSSSSDDKPRGPRPARRNTSMSNQSVQKTSKFAQGEILVGTVKNLSRAGAFISLPEEEEGFLPTSEELVMGLPNRDQRSSLEVGEEVSVRVLRVTKGQVTLTMKKEGDATIKEYSELIGEVHVASNPFLMAFRKNKDIATFLDEREKVLKSSETSAPPKTSEVQEQPATSSEDEISVPSAVKDVILDTTSSDNGEKKVEASAATVDTPTTEPSSKEEIPESPILNITEEVDATKLLKRESSEISVPSAVKDVILDTTSSDNGEKKVEASAATVDTPTTEPSSKEEIPESPILNITEEVDATNETVQKEEDVSSTTLTSEGSVEEAPVTNGVNVNGNESDPTEEVGSDPILSSETVNNDVVVESPLDEEEKEVEASAEKVDAPLTQESTTIENEVPLNSPVEDEKVESTPETDGTVATSVQEASSPAPPESTTKAAISPALVKHLREETGAGMMDCKKALTETGGDIVKAQEFLRKKGLASADKKASRATSEGRIGSYIHDGRIGVLLEVNCETDFVSRGDIFKELVDDLAMQVAACPQVKYVATEDVPEEIVNKEREIEMQKEDLLSKPEQIRSKIVEGRISKMVQELALLEQSYIKNDKVVVKDWVKQTIATVGENMKVKRFVRYNLGEGLEKKSQDFAAEVAAQTAAKQSTAEPAKDQPAVVEPEEVVEKPPTVTVSAALVKQLREETGAGMMDCKKALAETGGDVEKAQEFLRKKGLLTADKKSSRLAAEGRIGSYIHDSRIGVLIEVNCETDFVGRSDKFKELVDDLAMQVVACPQVQVVSIEDIPESIRNREKELEMQREDLQSKPENIREKIVEGRVSKRLGELALLEQPYIKNDSLLVKDLVKQTVAALGENIKVRRFTRFTLGEGAT